MQNISYKPKIAVDGFLQPGRKVEKIHIFRNFKLDQNLNEVTFFPENTSVSLIDESNPQKIYNLSLHIPQQFKADSIDFEEFYYEYNGTDLVIEHGKSYTLEVTTTIDGENLWTRSTTTVPEAGFKINSVNFNALKFAQEKGNGELEVFEVAIQRSPGITYYLATITPEDTTFADVITEHLIGEIDEKRFRKDRDNYLYDTTWIQNTPAYSGESVIRLFWFDFYFYSQYQVVVYAADSNFREYLLTYNRVQEPDGNFHEARFNFEGDGIGIFGSYISDTTYVSVIR